MRRYTVVILLSLLGLITSCGRWAPTARSATVAPGVTLAGSAIGGLPLDDLATLLQRWAEEVATPARNAYRDPETQGLVPGVDGVRLDVTATMAAIAAASPDAALAPVLVPVPPTVNLSDLPPAPIYNGSTTRSAVAFVINIAWGERFVPPMLAALGAAHTPATFCLVGRWAEAHPETVASIIAAGKAAGTHYDFCNHGYRDHSWANLSQAQAYASITRADRVIEQLTGSKPAFFSPHKGEWNAAVLAASREAGHELILWSVDTIDWQNPSPATVLRRVLRKVGPGSIVLMHPTASTAEALPALIAEVRAKGLRLVTLSQLLSPAGDPLAQAEG